MAGRTAHIAGVRAQSDTLTIRLLAPAPDFLARLSELVFCAVPSNTPIDPRSVRTIPSAGPYYVSSYTPGQAPCSSATRTTPAAARTDSIGSSSRSESRASEP